MSGALTLAAAFIIYSIYKYYKESQEEKEAEENRYFEELMSEKSETKENNELSLTSGDMDTRDLARYGLGATAFPSSTLTSSQEFVRW